MKELGALSDATAQAELVRSGQVTPEELVHEAISRTDSADSCNALTSRRFDRALTEARNVADDAPFRGVPIVVKDLDCAVAGEPVWNGNVTLRDLNRAADRSSPLVGALRRAGFTVLARSATAEFGATITTEPRATGPCRNPWRHGASSGGSSGGSAVAVATDLVPLAHGSDAAGSVRIPAALCGVVGYKPSHHYCRPGSALRPDPEDRGGWFGLSTPGVLARSIRDLRGLVSAMSTAAEVRARAARPDPGWESATCPALRIVVADHAVDALPSATRHALRSIADLLASAGHQVIAAQPEFFDDPRFQQRFATLVSVGLLTELRRWERRCGLSLIAGALDDSTRALVEHAGTHSAESVGEAGAALAEHRERALAWWDATADVVLTPVLPVESPDLGYFTDPERGSARTRDALRFTPHANAFGYPAMSLPLATTKAGMPLGIQLIGAPGRDAVLLELARDLERLSPWTGRRPPPYAAPPPPRSDHMPAEGTHPS